MNDERADTIVLADKLLDQPWADPDDDLRTLARQFLRAEERISALEARCAALLADVNQDEGYERLKARVAELEAALREANLDLKAVWIKTGEGLEGLKRTEVALGLTKETGTEPDSQCVTTLSGKHWWVKQDDGTLKCQSCNRTALKIGAKHGD